MRQFPFQLQKILCESLREADHILAQAGGRIDTSQLDQYGECDCEAFRKYSLPCFHMMENWVFAPRRQQLLEEEEERKRQDDMSDNETEETKKNSPKIKMPPKFH